MSAQPLPIDHGNGVSDEVAVFVRGWMKALRHTSYVPMPWMEKESLLIGLAKRLIDVLRSDPFDAADAFAVGSELVASHFATPEALGRTVSATRDMTALIPDVADADTRVTLMQESLSCGFAHAMYDRSLDGQEAVRLAALSAQARAEEALKASEARFRHFATHDELTDLPNRTRFAERLRQVIATARPEQRVGVCCIDLDGFNVINDSLGHSIGDRLLVAAAKRLTVVGTTVAGVSFETYRLHGDEYALLLPDIDSAEELRKAARLAISAMGEPFNIGENELPMTASAGIAESLARASDPTELLRCSEIALHWAKNDGKGKVRSFEPRRSDQDAARYRLSAAMPSALRRGEFTLAYQPLVDMTTGRMTGVEALARWRHPDMGVLLAGDFIQLAEDTGLITALDDHLLERACRQAAEWQDGAGEPLYVSVNLASRQLHRDGLVGLVTQVLADTGLEPQRLQLEITEHAVIDTDEQAIAALTALAGLGVRIVIDDFGTGYSNLACLSQLPVQGLKLDAAFASNLGAGETSDQRQHAFLSTVVQLGHVLELDVIAEGIETDHQAKCMREVGCDTGQGWLFGRPASPRAIEVMRGRRLLGAGASAVLRTAR